MFTSLLKTQGGKNRARPTPKKRVSSNAHGGDDIADGPRNSFGGEGFIADLELAFVPPQEAQCTAEGRNIVQAPSNHAAPAAHSTFADTPISPARKSASGPEMTACFTLPLRRKSV
ncbi:hypothetical protein AcW1_007141 [Taiwanofungus camphoratus]|nr:hypothetical protein AcW1_007141 [Antrodia cinnamomea]